MDSLNTENHSFENPQILAEYLPDFTQIHFEKLSPKYMIILGLRNVLFFGLFIAAWSVFHFVSEDLPSRIYIGVTIAWIALGLLRLILIFLTFPKRGYAIRSHDILFRTGIWVEETTIVPIHKLQHIVYQQGFVEKLFDLARLEGFTAGGGSSDISLYGISKNEILKIQNYLQEKMNQEPSIPFAHEE